MPRSPLRRLLSFRWILPILLLAGRLAAQTANPFEGDIRAFEAADLKNPPATNSILFLGSSSIRIWTGVADAFPDYAVLNRGFGGSQASDVLHFFDRLVPPYRPPLVVFYEGDNDLAGGKPVDTVFSDWTNFVARVESALPETHIMFLSVKPSPSRAQLLGAMRELNERVRDHCATSPKLRYTDVFTPMLNASGQPRPELFGSDNLHMNATGYALWQSVIGPALDAWAADYPVPVKRPETGTLLIDFGGEEHPSGGSGPVAPVRWNNVTASVGGSAAGTLATVVATDGTATGVQLRMVSRFNGANENGTAATAQFPATASRDSLFGNTETFSGLANVTPVFRLTGLPATTAYRLTFYASRLGVSDNRETRYTVAGATELTADLNVAGNVDGTASIPEIRPDNDGSLTISLTPGPGNNNANHFTYLGVLQVAPVAPAGPGMLFDFGSASSPTGDQVAATGPAWNDLTPAIGTSDDGVLPGLADTNGAPTAVGLKMISRFNGANQNGTLTAGVFPPSATRDSLFGNTAAFNGLADVFPAFRLTGLNPRGTYTVTFHASRTGVTDNRETRYRVTGVATHEADLNASGNVDGLAVVSGAVPDASGELGVALLPGPNNDNANRFTYLGALRLDWTIPPAVRPRIIGIRVEAGRLVLRLRGTPGVILRLQRSGDLASWQDLREITAADLAEEQSVDVPADSGFYRLRE